MSDRDDRLAELEAKIRAQLEEYSRKTGYRLNPDPAVVERLITAFAKRAQRLGQPYCPCRVTTGDPEKDKAIICPCIYHKEEIARSGICHCQLFCSPEYEAAHRQGRRPEQKRGCSKPRRATGSLGGQPEPGVGPLPQRRRRA